MRIFQKNLKGSTSQVSEQTQFGQFSFTWWWVKWKCSRILWFSSPSCQSKTAPETDRRLKQQCGNCTEMWRLLIFHQSITAARSQNEELGSQGKETRGRRSDFKRCSFTMKEAADTTLTYYHLIKFIWWTCSQVVAYIFTHHAYTEQH